MFCVGECGGSAIQYGNVCLGDAWTQFEVFPAITKELIKYQSVWFDEASTKVAGFYYVPSLCSNNCQNQLILEDLASVKTWPYRTRLTSAGVSRAIEPEWACELGELPRDVTAASFSINSYGVLVYEIHRCLRTEDAFSSFPPGYIFSVAETA